VGYVEAKDGDTAGHGQHMVITDIHPACSSSMRARCHPKKNVQKTCSKRGVRGVDGWQNDRWQWPGSDGDTGRMHGGVRLYP